MFPILLFTLAPAFAAPPSSTLTGPNGTLSWAVSSTGGQLVIDGRSPKWTVHHVAASDLRPIRTERSDAEGNRVTVDYNGNGAVVHIAGKDLTVTGTDIWDGDTVDIRLGQRAAEGKADVTFQTLDPASGSVYGFEARTVGRETCGATSCLHVHLSMTGIYRLVGPSWEYWFGPDGQLLRFLGPIGEFDAAGAR